MKLMMFVSRRYRAMSLVFVFVNTGEGIYVTGWELTFFNDTQEFFRIFPGHFG